MNTVNTNKKAPTSGTDISSISGVLSLVMSAFSVPDEPVSPLPPPLILSGAQLRTGLSASSIAARIISRQSQSGRQVGNVFADGANVEEAMELIRVEEIVNAILTEARVDVVIEPGISITAVGVGNFGAPVISEGETITMGIGSGIIR
jgi:hypothetical protein